ncbi:hypothetical protein [Nonomuraea sp. 10N515B]|uniref:hypothetical protein n=1 Tax=Nonomuraea sp. 10N515B TaxID=3457422 RepID=UPI003FCDFD02
MLCSTPRLGSPHRRSPRRRALVREATAAKVGWTVANQALVPAPGGESKHAEEQNIWEDMYLEPAREAARRRERYRSAP